MHTFLPLCLLVQWISYIIVTQFARWHTTLTAVYNIKFGVVSFLTHDPSVNALSKSARSVAHTRSTHTQIHIPGDLRNIPFSDTIRCFRCVTKLKYKPSYIIWSSNMKLQCTALANSLVRSIEQRAKYNFLTFHADLLARELFMVRTKNFPH